MFFVGAGLGSRKGMDVTCALVSWQGWVCSYGCFVGVIFIAVVCFVVGDR